MYVLSWTLSKPAMSTTANIVQTYSVRCLTRPVPELEVMVQLGLKKKKANIFIEVIVQILDALQHPCKTGNTKSQSTKV